VLLGYIGWLSWGLIQYQAAITDLKNRRFDSAATHLQQSLRVWPTSAENLLLSAQAARRSGSLDDARRLIAAAKNAGATPDAVEFERELLLLQTGAHPRPDTYQQACEQNPQVPESQLIAEALILGSLAKLDLAMAHRSLNLWESRLQEEIPLSPADRVQGKIWRAEVAVRGGDVDTAIARLHEAVSADPGHEEARLRLAELLVRPAPRLALSHLETLSAQGFDQRRVDLTRVRALRAVGELEQAETIAGGLAEQFADDQEILLERGLVALDLLEAEAALGWLRKAEQASAQRRDVNLALARALQLAGQHEAAARYREKVAALDAILLKRTEAVLKPEREAP
jgi:tetratricopeptide (TPR) repeat protein